MYVMHSTGYAVGTATVTSIGQQHPPKPEYVLSVCIGKPNVYHAAWHITYHPLLPTSIKDVCYTPVFATLITFNVFELRLMGFIDIVAEHVLLVQILICFVLIFIFIYLLFLSQQ